MTFLLHAKWPTLGILRRLWLVTLEMCRILIDITVFYGPYYVTKKLIAAKKNTS